MPPEPGVDRDSSAAAVDATSTSDEPPIEFARTDAAARLLDTHRVDFPQISGRTGRGRRIR